MTWEIPDWAPTEPARHSRRWTIRIAAAVVALAVLAAVGEASGTIELSHHDSRRAAAAPVTSLPATTAPTTSTLPTRTTSPPAVPATCLGTLVATPTDPLPAGASVTVSDDGRCPVWHGEIDGAGDVDEFLVRTFSGERLSFSLELCTGLVVEVTDPFGAPVPDAESGCNQSISLRSVAQARNYSIRVSSAGAATAPTPYRISFHDVSRHRR